MSKQLKTLLIIVGAALALWLAITLPNEISYHKSENYQYDKKCSELEKQLKSVYKEDLGELKVSFSTETNTMTVSFYESGYKFDKAYECKKSVEDYVSTHGDFFVHSKGSNVEVQSKTDPYYDYPREMYIYKSTVSNGELRLSEMQLLTDSYAVEYSQPAVLDITALTVTDYGNYATAALIIKQSPMLSEISFTHKYHQPDDEQLAELKENVGEACTINLYENND